MANHFLGKTGMPDDVLQGPALLIWGVGFYGLGVRV